jgi:phospholipid/cholesterol/gamma-HCH transport system permease protein
VLNGDWRTLGLGAGLKRLQSDLDSAVADPTLFWDLSGVQAIDHTGAILLWRSWGRKLPQRCDIPPRVLELLEELPEPPQPAARQPMGPGAPLVGIGNLVFRTLSQSRILLTLAGTLLLDFAGALRNTRRFPALEVSAGIYRTGVQALGITA